jgi:hypothetical protein
MWTRQRTFAHEFISTLQGDAAHNKNNSEEKGSVDTNNKATLNNLPWIKDQKFKNYV